jgi:nitroreductase
MEYSELIAARYSVRAYRPDPVEDGKLGAVLEAARLAPTAANRQPIQLVVMHTAGREEEIMKIYRRSWFVQAPLVIAVCAISSQAWVRESDRFNARLIDAAIVADHLILAAADLGLGTCWIAAFNVEAARSVLGLPAEAEPVIFTPLGYPADQINSFRLSLTIIEGNSSQSGVLKPSRWCSPPLLLFLCGRYTCINISPAGRNREALKRTTRFKRVAGREIMA